MFQKSATTTNEVIGSPAPGPDLTDDSMQDLAMHPSPEVLLSCARSPPPPVSRSYIPASSKSDRVSSLKWWGALF